MAAEIVKQIRLRGKVSMKGPYWKPESQKEDSTGENDLILTLNKNRKEYYFEFERVGGPGYNFSSPVPVVFKPRIGGDSKYQTTDDLVKEYILNLNKVSTISQKSDYDNPYNFFVGTLGGYGRPEIKDFIPFYLDKKGISGATQANSDFYQIVQDPYVASSTIGASGASGSSASTVPVIPEGYFSIWNEWMEVYKKWDEDSKKTESESNNKPNQNISGPNQGSTGQIHDTSKSYIFDVTTTDILMSAEFGTFSLVGTGVVDPEFTFTEEEAFLDEEYQEAEFEGSQEEILPEAEVAEATRISAQDASRVEEEQKKADKKADSGGGEDDGNAYKKNTSNSSFTVKGAMPVESTKTNSGGKVQFGFNGVPYYTQADARWGNVLYGWVVSGGEKMFIEEILPAGAIADGKKKADALTAAKADDAGEPTTFKLKISGTEYTFKAWIHAHGGVYGWSSIHGGGCGITSLSMVINYWEKKMGTARWVSPIKTAKIACEYGFRDKIGQKGSYPPEVWKKSRNEPQGSTYGSSAGQKLLESEFSIKYKSISRKDIEKYLSKGWPVIVQVKNLYGKNSSGETKGYKSGHYMVLTGLDYLKSDYGITTDPVNTLIYRNNDPGTPNGPTYFSKKDIDNGSIVGFHVFFPKSKNADNPDDVRENKISITV